MKTYRQGAGEFRHLIHLATYLQFTSPFSGLALLRELELIGNSCDN